jgi:hypothetical protein
MVEHSFRKAGVEGPTPSIGYYLYYCLIPVEKIIK